MCIFQSNQHSWSNTLKESYPIQEFNIFCVVNNEQKHGGKHLRGRHKLRYHTQALSSTYLCNTSEFDNLLLSVVLSIQQSIKEESIIAKVGYSCLTMSKVCEIVVLGYIIIGPMESY